ncbi:MAG: exodeoxyribonuclease VII large subunit [Candidatus Promineifilaceae bacterium]
MGFLDFESGGSDIWTVGELTSYIKELFDIDFRLRDLEVAGEISNFTRARSGHIYFTLKDEEAQLKCVMWRTSAERLRFDPQEGDAVVVHGRISVYEASGVYQLYADRMEPEGRGGLALAFERLKEMLAAEGLFDAEHKKPLPAFPGKIGLVTSADAAALRDILNVLHRRDPLVNVLLAPTLVQGEEAPRQIVRALQWLDGRDDVDLIIVSRGGGSIEDLWAFNDEGVARAIFAARHPIISGVGHETDFTIADFVADMRAPTPSAAAELAVPDLSELLPALDATRKRLAALAENQIEQARWKLAAQRQSLSYLSPVAQLDSYLQLIDALQMRMENAVGRTIERAQAVVTGSTEHLQAVSPLATLKRGYAIVRHKEGRIITSISHIKTGDAIEVRISDGSFDANVD